MEKIEESKSEINSILLSLGSNIGDKERTLNIAIDELKTQGIIVIDKISSFYFTEPYGVTEQDWFVNLCIYGTTILTPIQLLDKCKEIEIKMGRKERQRWHEREIDIDIILFNDLVLDTEILTIPHKEYKNRNFVLAPAAEIVGELIPSDSEYSISELAKLCNDKSGIKKI